MDLKYQILLTGVGSYLPKKKISNHELENMMDTSDEWITKRTGIKFRHFVGDNELTSDMGTNAAKLAISNAGLKPNDIDLIIVATTTPDNTFPSTASKIQRNIGCKQFLLTFKQYVQVLYVQFLLEFLCLKMVMVINV